MSIAVVGRPTYRLQGSIADEVVLDTEGYLGRLSIVVGPMAAGKTYLLGKLVDVLSDKKVVIFEEKSELVSCRRESDLVFCSGVNLAPNFLKDIERGQRVYVETEQWDMDAQQADVERNIHFIRSLLTGENSDLVVVVDSNRPMGDKCCALLAELSEKTGATTFAATQYLYQGVPANAFLIVAGPAKDLATAENLSGLTGCPSYVFMDAAKYRYLCFEPDKTIVR